MNIEVCDPMLNLTPPEAVLFDLGGTILEFDTYIDPSTGNDGAQLTLDLAIVNPHSLTAGELSVISSEIAGEFEAKRKLGNIEYPADLMDRHVYEPYGLRFDISSEELAERVFRNTHRGARVEAGAEEVFKTLKSAAIPMGIVSNSGFTARAVFSYVREFKLDHYFEFMMSTADYGFRKPDARILLTACRRLGLDPAQVWYVGNSIEHDVTAARRAGMPAIWYNGADSPSSSPTPDATISSWQNLTQILGQLLRE